MLSYKRPKDYIIEKLQNQNFKKFALPKDYLIEKIYKKLINLLNLLINS